MTAWTRDRLDELPRLGWVQAPTPVTELPPLARELGLEWLGVKRDDLAEGLCGATKTRKLDFLLGDRSIADAATWASIGAIGSGHLAALTLAAGRLGHRVEAYCFWEPPSADVEGNLAAIVSGPTSLHYHRSRLALALAHPRLLLGGQVPGAAVIPPGGSSPRGVLGVVRGGLELADQIRAGELPRPDRVYVPWGTGGTAVGLALGLALGGLPLPVRAIATVERPFATRLQARSLRRRTLALLKGSVGPLPAGVHKATVEVVHGFVGDGYGCPTPEAMAQCDRLAELELHLEPVYGGKAFAALAAHEADRPGGRVLYWLTSHRGTLPRDDDWRDRLPVRLARDLGHPPRRLGPTRRRLLVGTAAAAGLLAVRTRGYAPRLPRWNGSVLARWEAAVVVAAAEAVIPDVSGPLPRPGPDGDEIAANVDRYLSGMPPRLLAEVHGMMLLLEQGTGLDGGLRRLTNQAPQDRRRFLGRLRSMGGLMAQASRGIRDLVLLGWYQDPRTWPQLGYGGPRLALGRRSPRYDALIAPSGQLPRSAA